MVAPADKNNIGSEVLEEQGEEEDEDGAIEPSNTEILEAAEVQQDAKEKQLHLVGTMSQKIRCRQSPC